MVVRIITAIVAIIILLPVLIFSDTVVFPIVMAICSLIAVFEMLRCCGLLHKWAISVPMLVLSLAPMIGWFENSRSDFSNITMVILLVMALYVFAVLVFSHGKVQLQEISTAFLTCFYIIAAFSCLVALRYGSADGKYLYLISFIGAWVTDTFAYFTGRFFGKHKLIPDVSPKKTVEGSIGGTVFCVLSMLLYGFIINSIAGDVLQANYVVLGGSGIFISVVSQIGDLTMSAVKRHYGIKDYGKLFPGHGGMLDRFDSVMAVAVVLTAISSVCDLFVVI